MSELQQTRGVFFLANDAVYDLTLAFLNSFRLHNSTIPLVLIPFDGAASRVADLAKRYAFSVLAVDDLLRRCDMLGEALHGRRLGHYRKFAAWHGPFREFVYIDVDTVVLSSVDFCFGYLSQYDFVTSHAWVDGAVEWTWRRSARTFLTPEQMAFAANTGFIVSRREALTLDAAFDAVHASPELGRSLVSGSFEQSFLNYAMVTSGASYTSLLTIAQAFHRAGLRHDIPLEHWAGNPRAETRNGTARIDGRPVLLVHWAGQWKPGFYERWLARARRIAAPASMAGTRCVPRALPYADLWLFYRDYPWEPTTAL